MTSFISASFRSRDSQRGFTLVEMLVSIAIMMTITTVVAFNQSKYSSGAELKNLANNLSLSLRQAQVYGISVKEFSAGSNDFNVGYGVEFDISGRGDNRSYVFFADRGTRDGIYNGNWSCPVGGSSECLDKVALSGTNYIQDLCFIDVNGNEGCDVDRLDISFVRPATDARIIINGDAAGSSGIRGARIRMMSGDGTKTNSVLVYVTGQISVQ